MTAIALRSIVTPLLRQQADAANVRGHRSAHGPRRPTITIVSRRIRVVLSRRASVAHLLAAATIPTQVGLARRSGKGNQPLICKRTTHTTILTQRIGILSSISLHLCMYTLAMSSVCSCSSLSSAFVRFCLLNFFNTLLTF